MFQINENRNRRIHQPCIYNSGSLEYRLVFIDSGAMILVSDTHELVDHSDDERIIGTMGEHDIALSNFPTGTMRFACDCHGHALEIETPRIF